MRRMNVLRVGLISALMLTMAAHAQASTLTIDSHAVIEVLFAPALASFSLSLDSSENENGGFVADENESVAIDFVNPSEHLTLESGTTATASADGNGDARARTIAAFTGGAGAFFVNTFTVSNTTFQSSLSGAQPGDTASASGLLELIYSITTVPGQIGDGQVFSGTFVVGQFNGLNLTPALPSSFSIPGLTSGAQIPFSNVSFNLTASLAGALDTDNPTPVPEPASLTLLGVGLAALGQRARKRARR